MFARRTTLLREALAESNIKFALITDDDSVY